MLGWGDAVLRCYRRGGTPPRPEGTGGAILSLGGMVADAGVGEGFTLVGRCMTLGMRNEHIPSRVFCEPSGRERGWDAFSSGVGSGRAGAWGGRAGRRGVDMGAGWNGGRFAPW